MIRVLHIVGSLERGGIETFLMNVYRVIDRNEIQFDFLIYNQPTENGYLEEAKSLGAKVYAVKPKREGFFSNYRQIKHIVRDNGYRIVWRSTDNCFGGIDIIAAAAGGAKTRILHSHSSNVLGVNYVLHYMFRPLVNAFSTTRLSCGQKAGLWMFGKREYQVLPNGIDTREFVYNDSKRKKIRQDYNIIGNVTLIGTVARFEKEKNHKRLIDIFFAYNKTYPDSVLMLIGTGSLEEKCKEKARILGIEDRVLFMGSRNDVSDLMQAMDVFLLPSLYEGFPITLIEAQTAGLPCVVSDRVSGETNIYGGVEYVNLSKQASEWCRIIHRCSPVRYTEGHKKVYQAGYDIGTIASTVSNIINCESKNKEQNNTFV